MSIMSPTPLVAERRMGRLKGTPTMRLWTERLRDPSLRQVVGNLVSVVSDVGGDDSGRVKGFCCLGVGCVAAGMQVATEMNGIGTFMGYSIVSEEYGEQHVNGLAPLDFILWLGFDRGQVRDDGDNDYDVYIDFPNGWQDDRGAQMGAGFSLSSCASLNDDGVTFPQIADLIDYFGVAVHAPSA